MAEFSEPNITNLLAAWSAGDDTALAELAPLVYAELRGLARRYMRRERAGHTLQTTALVHEAYLRIAAQQNVAWQNRAHFYAVAAQMMRRILVDYARERGRNKRGGDAVRVSLIEAENAVGKTSDALDLIALDAALSELEKFDERRSRVVELRFFGGLSAEETAHALGISTDTVVRDWRLAKAWLFRYLNGEGS